MSKRPGQTDEDGQPLTDLHSASPPLPPGQTPPWPGAINGTRLRDVSDVKMRRDDIPVVLGGAWDELGDRNVPAPYALVRNDP